VRTSEAGWVLSILLIFLFLNRRRVSWSAIPLFILGVTLAFLPIFYENTQLYGNPFYNGYSQIDSEAIPAVFAWHFESRFLSTVFSLLLPFGVKPLVMLQNAYSYLIWIFWWFMIPIIFGAVLARNISSSVRQYLFFYSFGALWLILFYGSWSFQDSVLSGPTLGTSYTRYWLPVYAFGLPFAVIAFDALREFLKRGSQWVIAKMKLFRLTMIGLALFSLLYVIVITPESLWVIRKNLTRAQAIQNTIVQKTESNAVLITERTDKIFFPERRVIFNDPLDEKKLQRILGKLIARVPVYYFTELDDRDITFFNEKKLARFGVAFGKGETILDQHLYRLQRK